MIHKYLNAVVISGGVFEKTEKGKLFLKVNRGKTSVAHISKVKYLGYAFYRYKGECRFRVYPKSVEELTEEVVGTFIKRGYVYKDKRVEIEWNFWVG